MAVSSTECREDGRPDLGQVSPEPAVDTGAVETEQLPAHDRVV